MAEDQEMNEQQDQQQDQQQEQAASEFSANSGSASSENLRVLENIEVQLAVEVGNTEMKIRDLLRLKEGSVIELDRLAGDPLDILVKWNHDCQRRNRDGWRTIWSAFTEIVDPEKRVETYSFIKIFVSVKKLTTA